MNDRLTIIHIAILVNINRALVYLFLSGGGGGGGGGIAEIYQPSNIPPDLILRVDKTELGPISNINEPLMKHFQF